MAGPARCSRAGLLPPNKKFTAITNAIKNAVPPIIEWEWFKVHKVVGQYGQYAGHRNLKNGVLGPNIFWEMNPFWTIGALKQWPSSKIVKQGWDHAAFGKWDLNKMADILQTIFADLVLL